MANPFKFGSIATGEYFTDRKSEVKEIRSVLASENHLILISPRRFGKTSLVRAVIDAEKRPVIQLDLQLITDVNDFAEQLMKRVLKIKKLESLKRFITSFRVVPTIQLDPITNNMEVAFVPTVKETAAPLLDVLDLIDKTGEKGKKPIVVFDEFQEAANLDANLLKQMRSAMQHHKNINYILLGSVESMMKQIFESKKSPFYHFGHLMTLKKIPYEDFFEYLSVRLNRVMGNSTPLVESILSFTTCHPYYTQQLAYYCYSLLEDKISEEDVFEAAVSAVIEIHSNDFGRLWNTLTKTDKKLLVTLSMNKSVSASGKPTSTAYSGMRRLVEKGYLLNHGSYEFDDPFFKKWIIEKRTD